ncbi:MAG: hypothetical protein V2I76_00980 [Roseobacter sp.]|jgi:hypothetical protein|nr:hypothetical protein [Roseobacter sp.]
MASISLGLAIDQAQRRGPADLRITVTPGEAIPLPAQSGSLNIRVGNPAPYRGNYVAQTDGLVDGPISLQSPQIAQDADRGVLRVVLQGLWAHDEDGSTPVFSYQWQRGGTDIPGATLVQYTPVSADAGQTLQLIETATDNRGARSAASGGVAIAALPDLFEVVFEPGAFARLVENDGRGFVLDDPTDVHDGSYAVDPAALSAGPVALTAPVLSGPGAAGATLAITPALFAYDAALGPVSLSYASSGTNAVDAGDPAAPTLLVDAADAETTLVVTVTATQAGVPVAQASGGVAIAALPDLFEVVLDSDGTLQISGNDGRSFVVDDLANRYDGSYSIALGDLETGPALLVAPVLSGSAVIGESLTITPPLFAYDPDLGTTSVSYATNSSNAVDDSDPDAPTLLVDTADAGQTLTVTATATQGAFTIASLSNGVTIPAAPVEPPVPSAGLAVSAIDIQDNTASTATPNYTVDLSGYVSGDLIYFAVGGSVTPTAISVGGTSILGNLVHTNTSGGGDRRIRIYELALESAGSATTAVNITLGSAIANHILLVAGVKNAVRGAASSDGFAGAQSGRNEQLISTVTPAGANNAILVFALGRDGNFDGTQTFTGATQLVAFAGATMGGALALAEDVPAAAYTTNFDGSPTAGTDDHAVVASLAFTEE